MFRSTRIQRRFTLRAAAAAALVAGGLVATPAAAAPAPPPLPAQVLAEYREQFPDVPLPTLYERLSLNAPRKRLLESYATTHSATFGGSWYDYREGIWHLQATTHPAADAMASAARTAGIAVRTHLVSHSLAALHVRAARIRSGRDPLSALSRGRVGVDVALNRVTVAASPSPRTGYDPMVRFVGTPRERATEQACTSRRNCGVPMRTGIILWRGSYANPLCSLGFTARATDGSQWALTAGHCVNELNESWGHGEQPIGLVRQCAFPGQASSGGCYAGGEVDVARIRISSSYWLQTGFGYMFQSPSATVDVDYAITQRATIEPSDVVCLSAWHANYTGFSSSDPLAYRIVSSDTCGYVEAASDAVAYGMPRVGGASTCGGDSGGGWVYYPGNGERWAYGLHHGALVTTGDHCSEGKDAWFSALPAINSFFDAHSAAQIRVNVR